MEKAAPVKISMAFSKLALKKRPSLCREGMKKETLKRSKNGINKSISK